MKVIQPKAHGVLDYVVVVFLLLSPSLFGMDGLLATFTYALGGIHFLLTIFTAYEPGLIKVIPFRLHGIIEFVVAIVLAGVAIWFNSRGSELGFTFYLVLAVVILLVYLLTNFRAAPVTYKQ